MLIVEPPGQAFDAAFGLGPIGDLGRNTGELATLAAYNPTDEGGQNRQMLGHPSADLARITLYQGLTYGTIAPMVVTHRLHLLSKNRVERVYTMRQPRLNI